MRAVADIFRRRGGIRHEAGFTIVELLVAATLLMVALGGAVVVATSASKSSTASSVRQAQTAILASASEKVRSDSSWTSTTPLTCGDVGKRTEVTSWLQPRIARELVEDEARGSKFVITATAMAVDSAADGKCPDDADGIVPDYYDVEVVARPDEDTAKRTPGAGPITEKFQVDFSSRTSGGRLSIQGCYMWPQTDERIPSGSCDDSPGGDMVILPPAQVPLNGGPMVPCTGSDDCQAWTCAHPLLEASCANGQHGDGVYVAVRPIAASGWAYTVTGDDPNTRPEPARTGFLGRDGSATIDAMLPGRYKVTISPPSSVIPWETHSVPASGIATVERGIRSKIVQMFRPNKRTQPVVVPVESKYPARYNPPWVGDLIVPGYWGNSTDTYLVPAPFGRTSAAPKGRLEKGAAEMRFLNPEPGLYAAKFRTGSQTLTLSDTAGFFFVPAGDDQPIVLPEPNTMKFRWTSGCDEGWMARTWGPIGSTLVEPNVVAPATPRTWTVPSCPTGGGGGGGGGGGSGPTKGGGGNA